MYKAKDKSEYSFFDFNQPLGMHMNPENRWIRLAELIPWDEYEEKYASRFMSDTGNVAKPCRMALGALIIQKRLCNNPKVTKSFLCKIDVPLFVQFRRTFHTIHIIIEHKTVFRGIAYFFRFPCPN